MKKVLFFLFTILLSISAKSQETPVSPNEQSIYKQLEYKVLDNANKKFIVTKHIVITNADGDFFWPIYSDYNTKLEELNNEYLSLYKEYRNKKESIVFSEAMDLHEGMMDVNKDIIKLNKKYFKKMCDGMNPVKVAEYFDLENEIQLKIRLEYIQILSESDKE